MGVNRVGFAITDDAVVRRAATQEVIRRYFKELCNHAQGLAEKAVPDRVKLLMDELGVNELDRSVVAPARQAAQDAEKSGKGNDNVFCGAALELHDGTIVIGRNSPLLHAASSCIINAIKHLAGLPDDLRLLSPQVIDSLSRLKHDVFKNKQISLGLTETLTALSVSSPSNPAADLALRKLGELKGCEMHLSHMPGGSDEAGLRRLGVNMTSEPVFANRNLFME